MTFQIIPTQGQHEENVVADIHCGWLHAMAAVSNLNNFTAQVEETGDVRRFKVAVWCEASLV